MKKGKRIAREFVDILLVTVIMLSVVATIMGLNDIVDTARVINYSGLVRGATQRLVKLELTKQPNDELIKQLDIWLHELKTGQGDDKLVQLDYLDYTRKLVVLCNKWEIIKKDISAVREDGEKETLISDSEEHFAIADSLVSAAESYSLIQSNHIKGYVYILLAATLILSLRLGMRAWQTLKLQGIVSHLNRIARADAATNLPNRYSCDEFVLNHNNGADCISHAAVMFDMNNLKSTNDRYGHRVGDMLIAGFATILGEKAKGVCFAGRWGGDEFVALFDETIPERVEAFINNIRTASEEFNSKTSLVRISFAAGSFYNKDGSLNMAEMIDRADKAMYDQKALIKSSKR